MISPGTEMRLTGLQFLISSSYFLVVDTAVLSFFLKVMLQWYQMTLVVVTSMAFSLAAFQDKVVILQVWFLFFVAGFMDSMFRSSRVEVWPLLGEYPAQFKNLTVN